MTSTVQIGDRLIGDGEPCFIISEIGINHNGDMDIARDLISASVAAGCDAVKFQKRTIEVVYTEEELARPRENPFGETNGDLKRGLEFDHERYSQIDEFCGTNGSFNSCSAAKYRLMTRFVIDSEINWNQNK